MADREYGLKFKTTADLQGAQQTVQELNKVQQAIKNLDQATGKGAAESAKFFDELRKNRNTTQDQAQYLSELTKEAKTSAETVEKQAVPAWKRLGDGFRKLGNEIPVLGAAINALKNPWSLLAAAVASFVIKVQEAIAEQEEITRKAYETSDAVDDLNRALKDNSDAANAARDSAAEYQSALGELNDMVGQVDENLSRTVKAIDADRRLEDKKDKASVDAQAAEIDAAVAQNKMTPAEGRAAKNKLKAGLAQRSADREEAALAKKRDATVEAEITKADIAVHAEELLPEAEAAAKASADSARRKKLLGESNIERIEKRRKEIRSEIPLLEKRSGPRTMMQFFGLHMVPERAALELQKRREELAGLDSQEAAIKSDMASAEDSAVGGQNELGRLRRLSLSGRRAARSTAAEAEGLGADLAALRQERAAVAPYASREAAAKEVLEAAENADRVTTEALKKMASQAERQTKAMEELVRIHGAQFRNFAGRDN